MPVAAMESARMIVPPLYRHFRVKILIGGDRLVADGQRRLQRCLRLHHGLNHLLDWRLSLQAFDGHAFGGPHIRRPVCVAMLDRTLEKSGAPAACATAPAGREGKELPRNGISASGESAETVIRLPLRNPVSYSQGHAPAS